MEDLCIPLSSAADEQTPSLRVVGWSVRSARMEDQDSDLCPVQKQGVCGDKLVKEFLYFSSNCSWSKVQAVLERARAFSICCAVIVSKVARLSGLS